MPGNKRPAPNSNNSWWVTARPAARSNLNIRAVLTKKKIITTNKISRNRGELRSCALRSRKSKAGNRSAPRATASAPMPTVPSTFSLTCSLRSPWRVSLDYCSPSPIISAKRALRRYLQRWHLCRTGTIASYIHQPTERITRTQRQLWRWIVWLKHLLKVRGSRR